MFSMLVFHSLEILLKVELKQKEVFIQKSDCSAIPMLFIKIKNCKQRLNLMMNYPIKQLMVFKNPLKFVLPLIIVGLLFSCTKNYYVSKNVPPGQAKKSTGAKSAKKYAPGQQKKH